MNVRDTSVSSNEGTGNFTNMLKLDQGDSKTSIDRVEDNPNSVSKYDRVKAGFNVSYDSNSF